jgi:hypothetical protein
MILNVKKFINKIKDEEYYAINADKFNLIIQNQRLSKYSSVVFVGDYDNSKFDD